MTIVGSVLPDPAPSVNTHRATHRKVVRAMEWGQHTMAVALTVVGVVRAVGGGVWPPAAIMAGLALIAWNILGAVITRTHPAHAFVNGWLVLLALVWCASVWISPEFVWVAFVLWLLAGHLMSLWWSLLFSGAVFTVVVLAPVLHHGYTTYANVFGPLIGGIFAYGISRGYLELLRDGREREALLDSLTQAQRETRELQDELVLAQRQQGVMAERSRLSRELHDTVAQSLSSIRLLAHAAREDQERDTLTQIEQLAGEGITDVRRIIAALTPNELSDTRLPAAIETMLARTREVTGIETELRVGEALPDLGEQAEIALLRTTQSALANVRQHAGASRVVLHLDAHHDTVRLDIVDDGRGFDPEALNMEDPQDGQEHSGYGLRFMRERLTGLGGGLDIETAPGAGTALSAWIPTGAVHSEQSEEQAES